MADKIHNLKQNRMTFEARGLISGVKSKNFYRSGTTKNSNSWNEINFGLTIAPQQTIFLKINGFTQDYVYFFEKVKKGEKGTTKKIAWKDRKNGAGENYRMNGINISVGKDGDKNVNEVMVPYDAVEYLHEHLKDGESFYIKGNIQPSSYEKDGNINRKVELIPNQMSFTNSPIDFDAEDFIPKAEITIDPFVFSSIDKEMDENDKATGRYVLQGYSIQYNAIELMNFIIEKEDSALANNIRKRMKPGNSMTMFGNIKVVHDIVEVESDSEDDWGVKRKSPQNRVNSRSRFEYVLYDVKGPTFSKEEYTEDDIADAIKAIKKSKDVEKNFGTDEDENDWTKVDSDDDLPWD